MDMQKQAAENTPGLFLPAVDVNLYPSCRFVRSASEPTSGARSGAWGEVPDDVPGWVPADAPGAGAAGAPGAAPGAVPGMAPGDEPDPKPE